MNLQFSFLFPKLRNYHNWILKLWVGAIATHGKHRTQVCIWFDDAGAGIPLGYGSCQPRENGGTINIYKWNSKYKEFIKKVLQYGWLSQNKNSLFATSLGLAYPKSGKIYEYPLP